MDSSDSVPLPPVAVIPFVGNEQSDDASWLGALLSRLLIRHLQEAEIPALDYNVVAAQLAAKQIVLPLTPAAATSLRQALKLDALVHGRYTLDEFGKMLGFRIFVESPDIAPVALEVSAPLAEFSRFLDRVALAIIDQLGRPIDDDLRQHLSRVPRPASFEALRQLARAYGAWARNQKELALAAVTSALALDGSLEEAAALEVAIARTANDTVTTRSAFKRWASIAEKQGRPLVAAERLTLLGHWLQEHGEWEEARRTYDDTRGIFTRQKNEIGEAQAVNNLANLELMRGKFQNAIQAYRRNLRILELQEDTDTDKARTLYNLSIAHKNLGQHEEAMRAAEEALSIARQFKDTAAEARCLIQRGSLHDESGHWAQANIDYAHAARLFDVLGDERGLAVVKTHQSIVLKQQGDYDRAESLLVQASEALEKVNDPHEVAVTWVNLADLYLSMGLYDNAWDHAERALEALSKLKSVWTERAREIIATLESIPEVNLEEDEPDEPAEETSPQDDGPLDLSGTVSLFSRSHPGDPIPPSGPRAFPGEQSPDDSPFSPSDSQDTPS
jgi:tetratricopeptide (TPR) repeat protein